MGKVHGSLARAGKVKAQTPKVEPTQKTKKPNGRAGKRNLYMRRVVVKEQGRSKSGKTRAVSDQNAGSAANQAETNLRIAPGLFKDPQRLRNLMAGEDA